MLRIRYFPGWPAADFTANEGRGADIKLGAVLARAQVLAAGEHLKQSQGRSFAAPEFECVPHSECHKLGSRHDNPMPACALEFDTQRDASCTTRILLQ